MKKMNRDRLKQVLQEKYYFSIIFLENMKYAFENE